MCKWHIELESAAAHSNRCPRYLQPGMLKLKKNFPWCCDTADWHMTLKSWSTRGIITTNVCLKFENNPCNEFELSRSQHLQWKRSEWKRAKVVPPKIQVCGFSWKFGKINKMCIWFRSYNCGVNSAQFCRYLRGIILLSVLPKNAFEEYALLLSCYHKMYLMNSILPSSEKKPLYSRLKQLRNAYISLIDLYEGNVAPLLLTEILLSQHINACNIFRSIKIYLNYSENVK